MIINSKNLKLKLSDDLTRVESLIAKNRELLSHTQNELFLLRARDKSGTAYYYKPSLAKINRLHFGIRYDFDLISVIIKIDAEDNITWSFAVENNSELAMEFIDFPAVSFEGKLRLNGGDCAVVSSYNEGLIVEDSNRKSGMTDPEFPSFGGYMMYPYMLSSPIQMWLFGNSGLLMAVKDKNFGPKGLDFSCTDTCTEFRTRIFLGGDFGTDIDNHVNIDWTYFDGNWQDGAAIYRDYAYKNLAAKELSELDAPDWYKNDMPLVITYPVRGIHDTDIMNPNKLFPYDNIFPVVDELSKKIGARIMVLLMHWEGTAPWAPPYVWPPFGGEAMFSEFMKKLHEDGNLLGVYCSGLGFTERSNLIDTYDLTEKIKKDKLYEGFTVSPEQDVIHSIICTDQRVGYDICPKTETGKKILDDALMPLLNSGVDYIQALDQNHGGGMYFCYGQNHGHPPVPGSWITDVSKNLLSSWKSACPNTLLGCESAAAEAYISDLRLSDNRYELCYEFGRAIPLYAFIYHKYLHNFMGNQVHCPISYSTEALAFRLAYSFVAGDLTTLVLNEDAEIMFEWGQRDFSKKSKRDVILTLVKEFYIWHKAYPKLFRDAEMQKITEYKCNNIKLVMNDGYVCPEKAVLSSAWKMGNKTVQLFANHTADRQKISLESAGTMITSDMKKNNISEFIIPPYSVVAVEF